MVKTATAYVVGHLPITDAANPCALFGVFSETEPTAGVCYQWTHLQHTAETFSEAVDVVTKMVDDDPRFVRLRERGVSRIAWRLASKVEFRNNVMKSRPAVEGSPTR